MHIKFTFSIRVQVSETRNYLGKPFPKLGNEFSMDMVRNTVHIIILLVFQVILCRWILNSLGISQIKLFNVSGSSIILVPFWIQNPTVLESSRTLFLQSACFSIPFVPIVE